MKENNKLLADFLELEITEFHGNLFLATEETFDLQYDEIWNPRLDWNQLMNVIEKIQEICAENDEWERFFLVKDEIPHLGNTYNECINFIKRYGTNFN